MIFVFGLFLVGYVVGVEVGGVVMKVVGWVLVFLVGVLLFDC